MEPDFAWHNLLPNSDLWIPTPIPELGRPVNLAIARRFSFERSGAILAIAQIHPRIGVVRLSTAYRRSPIRIR